MSEIVDQFFAMKTASDVADLVGTTLQGLNYWLYLQKPKYFEFQIPKKSGGARIISQPNEDIHRIQSKLNLIFQEIYVPRPSVHSYIRGRSVISNARQHVKKRYVLNIDLKDFFPSIHFGRVRGLFLAQPFSFPFEVATILTRLTTTYKGLPQGAPSSPVISNMICRSMDSSLQKLAKENQCFYTRYADDITFSTSKPSFPTGIAQTVEGEPKVGELIKDVIEEQHKFIINPQKVRLQNRYERQEVTGITVNRFTNVNRKYINQVRAMLHDLEVNGDEVALKRHLDEFRIKHRSSTRNAPSSFHEIVRGKVEFLGQVRGKQDKVYRDFMGQLGIQLTTEPQIFLNYASEDINDVKKLHDSLEETYGYKAWIDTSEVKGGDEWWEKIKRAIDDSQIFVACLSHRSVRKDGVVQQEIDYAIEKYKVHKDRGENRFFIIPLWLEDGIEQKLRTDLKKFSYLKYYGKNGVLDLRDSLKEHISKLTK